MTRRLVKRRRCEKCGRVSLVPDRRRRCRQQPFGPRSYWCYGWLRPIAKATWEVTVAWSYEAGPETEDIVRVTTETVDDARIAAMRRVRRDRSISRHLPVRTTMVRRVDTTKEAIMALAAEGAVEAAKERGRKPRPQDVAAAKLARARKRVSELTRKLSAVAAQLKAWEAKARRYAQQASMTDAEVEARSERGRKAAAARGTKRRGIALK